MATATKPAPANDKPTELATQPKQTPVDSKTIEQVLIGGDLATLTEAQRTAYYLRVCESIGVNPLTKPFDYLKLNGRLTLYARKDCTDQLRFLRSVSVTKLEKEAVGDVFVCTAYVADGSGRTDVSTGAVTVKGLQGDALCNAFMKAETKAKRRATLSICGLGMLDETELDTVHAAKVQAQITKPGGNLSWPDNPPEGELASVPHILAIADLIETRTRAQTWKDTFEHFAIGPPEEFLPFEEPTDQAEVEAIAKWMTLHQAVRIYSKLINVKLRTD